MPYEFEYKLTDTGNAHITKYRSSEFIEDTVIVPDSIDGHPVLRIEGGAFSYKTISDLYLPDSLLCVEYDAFYRFTGEIHVPYNVYISSLFGSNITTVYTAKGSCVDKVIKASGKKYPKIEYIYEDVSLICDNDITYFLRSNQTLDLVECHSEASELSVPSHCHGYPVKRICVAAFVKCTHLESISLPEGLEVIASGTFSDLKHLKTIILPKSVHTIDSSGYGIFGYYASKENVLVRSSSGSYAERWCIENAILFQPNGTEIVKENGLSFLLRDDGTAEVIKCDKSQQQVRIPSVFRGHRVLGIRAKAFEECTGVLRTVILEEGIRYIGDKAFSGVYSLGEILLPESLEVIGKESLLMCNLNSLRIPARVREIGQCAFGGRSDIAITVISGSYAEQYCKENKILYTSLLPEENGGQNQVVKNGFVLRLNGNGTASVVKYTGPDNYAEIPKTYLNYPVNEIEKNALRKSNIDTLVIPSTIQNIGEHALPNGYVKVTDKIFVGQEIVGHEYFQGCIKDTITRPIYEYVTNDVPIVRVFKDSYAEYYCMENKIPYGII